MIAVNTINGNRQELHPTLASATASAKKWIANGFNATVQWCDSFDNQMAVVVVTE